ncbi:MAG: alkaline phosphatase family protein, partial [Candidatus Tumulicola sp.]
MKTLAVLIMVTLVTACSSPFGQTAAAPALPYHAVRYAAGASPIQHVIVIVQENRSFDNLFYGFPGANTATQGAGKHGKVYTLQPEPLKWTWDLRHDHPQFLEDYDNGQVDGFDHQIRKFKTGPKCSDPINHLICWDIYAGPVIQSMAYAYVQPADVKPYWAMASQYALGDNTFASNNGPSFPSHQYLIAGRSGHASEVPTGQPWGCDAAPSITVEVLQYGQAQPPSFPPATGHETPGPRPCFTYGTIAKLLDAAKVSWRYYVAPLPNSGSNLSAFDAIQPVRRGPDWNNVVTPDTAILNDITTGKLQQVSWVMPTGSKSDHSGTDSGNGGPAWVASIVNAVGTSSYWKSTAIIVMWDEWGGWYDHVVPPQLHDPATRAYEGLGFRVPVIIVSPYAKANYVSHAQHEIASSLRFIEETFNLPSLGGADARTDGFDDMFDFTQNPIPFVPIPANLDAH